MRQTQILHRRCKGVEVPLVQVRMELEGEGGLHVILGLKVHLWIELSVKGYISDMFKETYVDQLVYILDVDLVASNAANEVH